MSATFKTRYTAEQRARRLKKVLSTNALPIVLEKCTHFTGPAVDVSMFRSAPNNTVADLKRRITESNPRAVDFVYYVDDGSTPLDVDMTVQQIYDAHKDANDGFLYLWYASEEAVAIDLTKPYREQVSFEDRCQKAKAWSDLNAVPLVCEPEDLNDGRDLPYLYERVYSERRELTVGEFLSNIKSRMSLDPTEALFLSVENQRTVSISATLGSLYDKYKETDGFLYLHYSREKTFG